ncbi:MAG: sugar phosphate isomerase/epimerase family protein, partial [Rhizomicrobium sp.]
MKQRILLVGVWCAMVCVLGVTASSQKAGIQVGYCAPLAEIDASKAAGFDYVELRVTEIAALTDADYDTLAAHLKQIGLAVPVANYFLPGSLKVTGPAIDKDRQIEYVRKGLDRVARLGAGIVVFGSGGARSVPPGFSKEEAFDQLVDFLRRVGPEARAAKITIAIEPLRRQESNIINSAAEGLQLVKAVNDPNIQLMVDFYHLAMEKEDPEVLVTARDQIRHLHMANPQGRVFPLKWDEYDYAPFFAKLRQT